MILVARSRALGNDCSEVVIEDTGKAQSLSTRMTWVGYQAAVLYQSLDRVRKEFVQFHSPTSCTLGERRHRSLIQNVPGTVPRSEVSASGPESFMGRRGTTPLR
jgi:hypothetical protein